MDNKAATLAIEKLSDENYKQLRIASQLSSAIETKVAIIGKMSNGKSQLIALLLENQNFPQAMPQNKTILVGLDREYITNLTLRIKIGNSLASA